MIARPRRVARPSSRRVRAAALLALAAAAVAVTVALTSGGGHHYTLIFQNAGQLVVGDQVQVGGVPEGSIDSIDLTDHNQAAVGITVDEPIAPLHAGSTAEIRSPSLSGVANRHIAIHPGPNNARELPDGAELGTTSTKGIVDVDQVFDLFDTRTRRGLRRLIAGQATQYGGAEAGVQASSHYFSTALSTTDQLVARLIQDGPALRRFLAATAQTMRTLAGRAPQIDGLVAGASGALSATAAQETALQQGVAELPGTVAAGTSAMAALRRTLPSLDRLVTATSAATPGMAGFLRRLRGLLVTATPVLQDVAVALDPRRPSLVTATAGLPALRRAVDPATRHSLEALRQLTPMLAFARPYTPDLASALRGFGQSAGPYDAVGHYVRGVVGFGAFSFDGGDPGTLTRVPPGGSLAHVQRGRTARCPGAATQPPADGSAPWVPPGGNCDPGQVPP